MERILACVWLGPTKWNRALNMRLSWHVVLDWRFKFTVIRTTNFIDAIYLDGSRLIVLGWLLCHYFRPLKRLNWFSVLLWQRCWTTLLTFCSFWRRVIKDSCWFSIRCPLFLLAIKIFLGTSVSALRSWIKLIRGDPYFLSLDLCFIIVFYSLVWWGNLLYWTISPDMAWFLGIFKLSFVLCGNRSFLFRFFKPFNSGLQSFYGLILSF